MKKRKMITVLLTVLLACLFFSCSKKSTTEPINKIPTCVISQPADGASLVLGDTVEIRVTASDEDGQVIHVKFFINDQLKHDDLESPFNFIWNTSDETIGEHVIRAEAVDNEDATGSSSSISISFTEPEIENIPPTCVISQPADGASLVLGDTVEIQVTANDEDGQVIHVKFFIDDQLRHDDFESPFNFIWNTSDETIGEHVIRAEAVDNEDATGSSSSISISFTEPEIENIPPTCVISQPADGASLALGDTVEIRATAYDEDGQVIHVKFFIDDQLRHDDFESPFAFLWDTSEETYGEHVILAEAIDDDEARAIHSVTVTTNWVYYQPEQVNDGWETTSLESVDMNQGPLVTLMNTLHNNEEHRVHGIVIARHGKLVFEEYFDGLTHPTWGETPVTFDRGRLHVSSSVTKSFTATLLGIAIDRGMISSVDEKVFDYYPELAHLNTEQKQDISLRHLVTMSSGLDWNESSATLGDSSNDLTRLITLALYSDEDLVGFILGKSMVADPGAVFKYSGGNTNVLGNIIQRASGLRLDAFANAYLFDPLGIEDSWWWLLRPDFVYASGDLALRLRDMAKFGQLFLQNGYWNGEQIVPEEWVTLSATPRFVFPYYLWRVRYGQRGYSFGWWPKTTDYGQGAYAAEGWGGQQIIVMPEYDMVVVFTGGSYWEAPLMTPHEMMVEYVLPSIQ